MSIKKYFQKKNLARVMMIFVSILFIFSLTFVMSCFELPKDKSSSPIKVELEPNGGTTLNFIIKNNGSNDLVFFDNDTPLSGHNKQYFKLTDEFGMEIPYIGRYAFVMNTRSRWVELKSGESKNVIVDLAGEYDLSSAGKYTISYVSSVATEDKSIFAQRTTSDYDDDSVDSPDYSEYYEDPISRNEDDKEKYDVVSNEIEIGIGIEELDYITRKPKPPAGGDCNKASFDKDKVLATTLSDASVTNLATAGSPYILWFGKADTKRLALVKANFGKIATACGGSWTYTCPTGQDCDGVIAWVYSNKPNTTWLCPSYMKYAAKKRALVLIHEASHWSKTAGTDDYGYWAPFCKALAKKDPNKAVKNADNYFYFAKSSTN